MSDLKEKLEDLKAIVLAANAMEMDRQDALATIQEAIDLVEEKEKLRLRGLALWADYMKDGWDCPKDDLRSLFSFTDEETKTCLDWSEDMRTEVALSGKLSNDDGSLSSGIMMPFQTIKGLADQRGLDAFEVMGWDPYGSARGTGDDESFTLTRRAARLLELMPSL